MAKLNMLDVAKLNSDDRMVGLIEENLSFAPELTYFPFSPIEGTSYKTIKRTGFPTVGFRKLNQGVTPSKSSFAESLHEAYLFSGRVECDRAFGQTIKGGMARYEMIESSGVARASMLEIGSQIWYGTTNDTLGFPGLKAITPKDASISPAVLDATGTTATTASSVYGVKFSTQDVTLIGGNNSTFQLGEFRDETIEDSAGAKLPGRVADLMAWIGLQVGNINCVGRICNLTADSGKGLTDSLLSQWLEKFPVGYLPDYIFMSRRSRGQLQRSRTVTLQGNGTNRPAQSNIAPLPTEYDGIPIIVTDSILNTDAIES
jgi:hypothetical protein